MRRVIGLTALAALIILMAPFAESILIDSTALSRSSTSQSSPFMRVQDLGGRACTHIKEPLCSGYLIRKVASGGCPTQPTCCGNNICETIENAANCYRDCKGQALLKDACPKAAYPACKGKLIFPTQRKGGCPEAPSCCGDSVCQNIEGPISCPSDCAEKVVKTERKSCPKIAVPRCNGMLIYPSADKNGCTGVPVCCGDKLCDKLESALSCPTDCGSKYISGNTYKPFLVKAKATFRDVAI